MKGLRLSAELGGDSSPKIGADGEEGTPSRMDFTTLEWPLEPEDDPSSFVLAEEPGSQGLDCLEAIGISSNEFLSIVDQIGAHDLPHELHDPPPTWMFRGI